MVACETFLLNPWSRQAIANVYSYTGTFTSTAWLHLPPYLDDVEIHNAVYLGIYQNELDRQSCPGAYCSPLEDSHVDNGEKNLIAPVASRSDLSHSFEDSIIVVGTLPCTQVYDVCGCTERGQGQPRQDAMDRAAQVVATLAGILPCQHRFIGS